MNPEVTIEGMLGMALPVATNALPQWHQELLYQDSHSSRKRQRFCTPPSTPPRIYHSDRFIPSRASMDLDFCSYMVTEHAPQCSSENETSTPATPVPSSHGTRSDPAEMSCSKQRYKETLAANLLYQSPSKHKKMLRFTDTSSPMGATNSENLHPLVESSPSSVTSHPSLRHLGRTPHSSMLLERTTKNRHIPSSPTRILDAPELRDDYYLNLVSWGDNNVLAVALDQIVYLYNTETSAIQEIKACTARSDYVTSVAWISTATSGGASGGSGAGGPTTDRIAIGTFHAELQVWDTTTLTKIRSVHGHTERIGSLAWNGQTLSSGSRDARILHHDLRIANTVAATLQGHHQEICGLAWSPDGKTLASGGNDNVLCLWDAKLVRSSSSVVTPRQRLVQHRAAVKALAWCPWERHLLASGGGTADRTIKFWNAATGRLLNSVPTGSQVCGLVWSRTERELLSSHGFSQNELCLWKYPTMVRLREFTGHTARVLHLAMSPDGASVVSAAADETLRFWNVFASSKHPTTASNVRLATARRTLFPDAVIR